MDFIKHQNVTGIIECLSINFKTKKMEITEVVKSKRKGYKFVICHPIGSTREENEIPGIDSYSFHINLPTDMALVKRGIAAHNAWCK